MTSTNAFAYVPSLAFSLLLLCFCSRVASDQKGFVKLNITSLLPSDTCVPSTPKVPRNHTIKMSRAYGPCSPSGLNKSNVSIGGNLLDIVLSDRQRIKYIAMKLGIEKSANVSDLTVPAISDSYSNFVIEIGLGYPKMTKQLVSIDTGSDLCWVNCKPCKDQCHDQYYGAYDPSSSETYAKIPYEYEECGQLDIRDKTESGDCRYTQAYGDGTTIKGTLNYDMLTLGEDLHNFVFGCGDTLTGNSVTLAQDGLIGMGRGPLSLFRQVASSYGNVFSYCLPTSDNELGHVIFGPPPAAEYYYTPMLTSCSVETFYYVHLEGIRVSGKLIPITPATSRACETVIDSGTTLMYIPPGAYDELKSIFSQGMSSYKTVPVKDLLCYDITGYKEVTVPSVDIVFENIELGLSGHQIVIVVPSGESTLACLAFQPSLENDPVNLVGYTQQRSYEVVHDLNKMQIGFALGTC